MITLQLHCVSCKCNLTESSKSSASIVQSNKQWFGTCLYQEWCKPLLISCEAAFGYEQVAKRIANIRLTLFYLTAFSAKIKEKKEEISKINVNLLPAPILLNLSFCLNDMCLSIWGFLPEKKNASNHTTASMISLSPNTTSCTPTIFFLLKLKLSKYPFRTW